MDIQKLLDSKDDTDIDTCNKILPTYQGFRKWLNKKGYQPDSSIKEWDQELFRNNLQGKKGGRKKGKGVKWITTIGSKRKYSQKGTPGRRNRELP